MLKKKRGKPRKLTPLEEQLVIVDYNSGMAVYEIVAKWKVSESTIHRIVRKDKLS